VADAKPAGSIRTRGTRPERAPGFDGAWRVERAQASDAPAIAALGLDAFARGWSAASVTAELARPGAEVWALRAGAALAGFLLARRIPSVSADFTADHLEVLLVAVRAPERRRGGGSALLQAALGSARRAGLRAVHLDVRASNQAALGLYRRFGFAEVGRRPRYYEGREDAVLMSLALREESGW